VLKVDGSASTGRWHPACVTAYKIAAWPAEARVAVYKKDKGRCVCCRLRVGDFRNILNAWHWSVRHGVGATVEQSGQAIATLNRHAARLRTAWESRNRKWQCDHIVELKDSDRSLAHWSVANMQVLCCACHAAKSAASRRQRSQKAILSPKPTAPQQKELW
jgi:hypothetical protein